MYEDPVDDSISLSVWTSQLHASSLNSSKNINLNSERKLDALSKGTETTLSSYRKFLNFKFEGISHKQLKY